MKMSASLHRCAAWLAALAILCAALAPSISHALAASKGGVIAAEICSASGIRQVMGPDGKPVKNGAGANPYGAHCPFCLNPDGGAGLPPSERLALPAPDAVSAAPLAAVGCAVPTARRGTVLARGPPAL